MDLDDVAGLVKFCLRVISHMFSTRQTYIPQRVILSFPDNVPDEIKFLVNNDDVFEGLLVGAKSCFLGLRKVLRQYRIHNISYLCFEYMGRGNFSVSIFDSAAVEIYYPEKSVYVNRKEGGIERVPAFESFKVAEVYTLQDNLNNNLLTLNACDCNDRKIFIYMEDQSHLKYEGCAAISKIDDQGSPILWDDSSTVFFQVGKKC